MQGTLGSLVEVVYYYRLGSQENCAQRCGFDSHRHNHFSALCITQTKKCNSNSIVALHDISCEFRHSDRGAMRYAPESSYRTCRLGAFLCRVRWGVWLKWFTSTDWVPKKTAHRDVGSIPTATIIFQRYALPRRKSVTAIQLWRCMTSHPWSSGYDVSLTR